MSAPSKTSKLKSLGNIKNFAISRLKYRGREVILLSTPRGARYFSSVLPTLQKWTDAFDKIKGSADSGSAVEESSPLTTGLYSVQGASKFLVSPSPPRFESYSVYSTDSFLFIVGADKEETKFRVIKLDRREFYPTRLSDILTEDPVEYTPNRIRTLLQTLHSGNSGGLNLLARGVGILGFVKFLKGMYLVLITARKWIGTILGHRFYCIEEVKMIDIPNYDLVSAPAQSKGFFGRFLSSIRGDPLDVTESRYKTLFETVLSKSSLRNFFWSYSLDASHTIQSLSFASRKFCSSPSPDFLPANEMLHWNRHLTEELCGCVRDDRNSPWAITLCFGFFAQRHFSVFGSPMCVSVIARRSAKFAGPRYHKRGVSQDGYTANEVESEQIVEDCRGSVSSFVQIRASIPTYWTQEPSPTVPKPPITRFMVDPACSAARLHFKRLFAKYGAPILCLNLVKKRERQKREMIVGNDFASTIRYLNSQLPKDIQIQFWPLDFATLSKNKACSVVDALDDAALWSLHHTGFFASCAHPSSVGGSCSDLLSYAADSVVVPSSPQGSLERKRTASAASLDPWTATSGTDPILTGARSTMTWEERAIGWDKMSCPSPLLVVENSSCKAPLQLQLSPHDSATITSVQQGIVRTNCIDCLDRTQCAQYVIGLQVLLQQLQAIDVAGADFVEPSIVLMDMYTAMGNEISRHYGGSDANKRVIGDGIKRENSMLSSIKRYYSNSFNDRMKQDALNLFLGMFVPSRTAPDLWEFESDMHLHSPLLCRVPSSLAEACRWLTCPTTSSKQWWRIPLAHFAARIGDANGVHRWTAAASDSDAVVATADPVAPSAAVVRVDGGGSRLCSGLVSSDRLTSFESFFARAFLAPEELAGQQAEGKSRSTATLNTIDSAVSHDSLLSVFDGSSFISRFEGKSKRDRRRQSKTSNFHRQGSFDAHHVVAARSHPLYERFVQVGEDPSVLESAQPTRRIAWYGKYTAPHSIQTDDVKSLRRLQQRCGVTTVLSIGPYKGHHFATEAQSIPLPSNFVNASRSANSCFRTLDEPAERRMLEHYCDPARLEVTRAALTRSTDIQLYQIVCKPPPASRDAAALSVFQSHPHLFSER